jgi:hypothetical protein
VWRRLKARYGALWKSAWHKTRVKSAAWNVTYGIVILALAVIVLPAIYAFLSKSPITWATVISWATVLYTVIAAALVFVFEMVRNFFVAAVEEVEAAQRKATYEVEAAQAKTAKATDQVAKLEKQLEPLLQQGRLRTTARDTLERLDRFVFSLIRRLPEEEAGGSINLEQWVANLDDVVQPLRNAVPDELKVWFSAGQHTYRCLADIRVEAEIMKDSIVHLAFY